MTPPPGCRRTYWKEAPVDLMVTVYAESAVDLDLDRDVDAISNRIPDHRGPAMALTDRSVEITLTGRGSTVGEAIDTAVAAVAYALDAAGPELTVRRVTAAPYDGGAINAA